MLDQNVPNPLAKNPNFYTHKVFAAVGIILIAMVIIGGGVWYFVQSAQDKNPPDGAGLKVTKIATSSANKSTDSDNKTNQNKSYSDNFFKVSFMYPENWEEKTKSGIETCESVVGPKGVKNSGFSICEFGQSTPEQLAALPNSSTVSLKRIMTINGKTVIRQVVTEKSESTVYVFYGSVSLAGMNGTLTIQAWSKGSGQTNEEFVQTVDSIVSSFKFL